MVKIAGISGKKTVKLFNKIGYCLDHQTGSHMILYHPHRLPLSIPNHKELANGLLKSQIKRAGITQQEFKKLQNK